MSNFTPDQLAALSAETKTAANLGVVISFTAFSLLCIGLRFYARFGVLRNAGAEDYFIGVAMAFSLAMAACMIKQVEAGNGRHAIFLTLADAIAIRKWLFWAIFAYCTGLTLVKISILLQFRRIFKTGRMRLAIYIVMALVVAYGIESVLTGIFTCLPVRAFWDLTIKPTAKCVDENMLWYGNAGINIATDWIIAALPVREIWLLRMPTRHKIAILLILGLGWFVCVVSVLRIHALVVLAKHPTDPTFYSPEAAYWSCIELDVTIVCASMPAMKPLLVRIFPSLATPPPYDGYPTFGSRGISTTTTDPKSVLEICQMPGNPCLAEHNNNTESQPKWTPQSKALWDAAVAEKVPETV